MNEVRVTHQSGHSSSPTDIHNLYHNKHYMYVQQTAFLTGQSEHDKYPKLQGVGDSLRYLPVALDVLRVGGTSVVGQQTISST